MTDLTACAAEGFDCYRAHRDHASIVDWDASCPYLNTSDAANAWHLGRSLAAWDEKRPTPGMKPRESANRIAISASRGDVMNMRGYGDTLLRRFRRLSDNSFVEAR
jgi:hypothetical protein